MFSISEKLTGTNQMEISFFQWLLRSVVVMWLSNKQKNILNILLRFVDGYIKNKSGDQCIPFCTECKYGQCIEPRKCQCDPGFKGPACDHSKSSSNFS